MNGKIKMGLIQIGPYPNKEQLLEQTLNPDNAYEGSHWRDKEWANFYEYKNGKFEIIDLKDNGLIYAFDTQYK